MHVLEEIAAKMKAYAADGDYEAAHVNADQLLVALVRALCGGDTHTIVEAILSDYDEVGKWYA